VPVLQVSELLDALSPPYVMSTCLSGSEVPVLQVSELLDAPSPHSSAKVPIFTLIIAFFRKIF
jgi:hypothetical protein